MWSNGIYDSLVDMAASNGAGISDMERCQAAMLLSAAGDSLGYKNMEWEYCTSGKQCNNNVTITLNGG